MFFFVFAESPARDSANCGMPCFPCPIRHLEQLRSFQFHLLLRSPSKLWKLALSKAYLLLSVSYSLQSRWDCANG